MDGTLYLSSNCYSDQISKSSLHKGARHLLIETMIAHLGSGDYPPIMEGSFKSFINDLPKIYLDGKKIVFLLKDGKMVIDAKKEKENKQFDHVKKRRFKMSRDKAQRRKKTSNGFL